MGKPEKEKLVKTSKNIVDTNELKNSIIKPLKESKKAKKKNTTTVDNEKIKKAVSPKNSSKKSTKKIKNKNFDNSQKKEKIMEFSTPSKLSKALLLLIMVAIFGTIYIFRDKVSYFKNQNNGQKQEIHSASIKNNIINENSNNKIPLQQKESSLKTEKVDNKNIETKKISNVVEIKNNLNTKRKINPNPTKEDKDSLNNLLKSKIK